MPILETLLLGALSSAAVDFSKEAVTAALNYIADKRPELSGAADAAAKAGDAAAVKAAVDEAIGLIVVAAAEGSVVISRAQITALRGVSFDHERGEIRIGNAVVSAPTLTVGGGQGATGVTQIGDHTLLQASSGSGISVGAGCGIVITGNAGIKIS